MQQDLYVQKTLCSAFQQTQLVIIKGDPGTLDAFLALFALIANPPFQEWGSPHLFSGLHMNSEMTDFPVST